MQYLLYFGELFEQLNRDGDLIEQEGKEEAFASLRALNQSNCQKGLVSPLSYYDQI